MIAGFDSNGGIQSDLRDFSAMGAYGAPVINAATAQNTKAVTVIHPIPDDVVTAPIEAFADALVGYDGPIVLAPVMVAKSDDVLLKDSAVNALKSSPFGCTTVLTPNQTEAAKPVGDGSPHAQVEALLHLGTDTVLMKGGHADEEICTDHLVSETLDLPASHINTRSTHGTGYSYSSAIAAGLAQGAALNDVLQYAHTWLHQTILHPDELHVGQGHGPVHHYHALWT